VSSPARHFRLLTGSIHDGLQPSRSKDWRTSLLIQHLAKAIAQTNGLLSAIPLEYTEVRNRQKRQAEVILSNTYIRPRVSRAHMESRINADQIRRRVPKGRKLPGQFDDFLRAKLPFRVEWNDLDAYGLKPSATKEAVPFLRLPDGGLIALWYHAEEPAVVHIGGHGELKVIASDFGNFLKSICARCSGLPDIDEGEESFAVPGVRGRRPNGPELPALQAKFDKWFKQRTSLLEPLSSPGAESLRQHVHKIAKDMIRDGRSKVYTLSSPWWSMDFQIQRDGEDLSITYLDFGKWYPVASKYKLAEEVVALLKLVKNKNRHRYELSTCRAGIVSIDRDRELVLVPPETEPE
jgi:hypothetical protein